MALKREAWTPQTRSDGRWLNDEPREDHRRRPERRKGSANGGIRRPGGRDEQRSLYP
jgi:hypothetical protein